MKQFLVKLDKITAGQSCVSVQVCNVAHWLVVAVYNRRLSKYDPAMILQSVIISICNKCGIAMPRRANNSKFLLKGRKIIALCCKMHSSNYA